MGKQASKAWKAQAWVENEVDDLTDAYGISRARALEVVAEGLELDEYRDALNDDQTAAALKYVRSASVKAGKE